MLQPAKPICVSSNPAPHPSARKATVRYAPKFAKPAPGHSVNSGERSQAVPSAAAYSLAQAERQRQATRPGLATCRRHPLSSNVSAQ